MGGVPCAAKIILCSPPVANRVQNTMAQAVRERIPELATLKTLGFTDRGVLGLVVEFLGDLSAFYLDVCKDWLYNDAENSPRRRSSLATIDTVLRATASVMAPLMPFTTEDVWDHLPKRDGDPASVHLTGWPSVETPADSAALLDGDRRVLLQVVGDGLDDDMRRRPVGDRGDDAGTRTEIAPAREGDFGEAATYVGDWHQTYEREHQAIFGPIAGLYTLVRRLSSGIIHTVGALG